jgi:hypothetical protein
MPHYYRNHTYQMVPNKGGERGILTYIPNQGGEHEILTYNLTREVRGGS